MDVGAGNGRTGAAEPARRRHRRIPIIFITAFPEERIRKRAEAAGAIGFFSKPVDSQVIIGCLDGALKRG